MSKWWEKKDPANYSEWQTLQTPEGLDYYYNTVTNVTTWDKPDALKSADELSNQGDWVWMPDDRDCFIPATVQSQCVCSPSNFAVANLPKDPTHARLTRFLLDFCFDFCSQGW